MRVLTAMAETFMDKAVVDALMLSPLQVSFSVVIGLTGFGAPNFFVFLQNYFVGGGITNFDRTYTDAVMEFVSGAIEDSVPKVKRAFIRWINIKDEEE